MGLVTYIPRYLPLLLLSKIQRSEHLNSWLQFIPVAVFSALIFSDIFVENQQFTFINIKVLISIVVFFIAIKFKSIGASIVSGLALYYFLTL